MAPLPPNLRRATVAGVLVCLLAGPSVARAQSKANPRLGDDQLLLLREADQLVDDIGGEIWSGWERTPKTTLIVGRDHEHLIDLPRGMAAPAGFEPINQRFMGSTVYARPRTLPRTLRSAFPVDGVPAAVVDAWRSDVESPNEWVVGLVEQWFRLLQMQRGEQAKVADLQLASPEMPAWQIDYPFPFDDPDVGNAMLLLGQSLYDFWATGSQLPRSGQRVFLATTAWAALQNLRAVLTLKYGDAAYKFFQMQTWREGVARYSSILVARQVARAELVDDYQTARGFEDLPEHKPYARMWEENLSHQFWLIRTSGVEGARDRMSFDAIGHGMAELLDALDPEWKSQYFDRGVWLDDLVAEGLGKASDTPRATARR